MKKISVNDEGMILAHDLYEILDDVGEAICCDNCKECVFQDVCYYCEDLEEEDDY